MPSMHLSKAFGQRRAITPMPRGPENHWPKQAGEYTSIRECPSQAKQVPSALPDAV